MNYATLIIAIIALAVAIGCLGKYALFLERLTQLELRMTRLESELGVDKS